MINELIKLHEIKGVEIKRRLQEFKEVFNQNNERVLAELAFCLCTPQSKATVCWNAIESLMKNNLLYIGTAEQIKPFLNAVRFSEKKSKYIVAARELFTENGKLKIKEKIKLINDVFELREWLVENVKGLGMKESSHFLRNIGFSHNLAILDRHILKNLKELKVIDEIPKSLTKKKYLEIEQKMKAFAKRISIPLDNLDLLLWSKETGEIFK